MLLRRSGEQDNTDYHLAPITGVATDTVGVPHEAELLALADAVYAGDSQDLAAALSAVAAAMGELAMLDAIGVASAFNGITKIANATGIPLDDTTASATTDMRQATRIDEYAEAHKSSRWDN